MNLFELFVKIGVDDQASGKLKSIGQKLGNGLKTAAKVGTAAVGVASAAIVALTTQAVNSFAEYEQLAGGAQKIFDQMDYSKIATDANNAYKELGLSANQYLAVINDVGATFAATMGDEAGYEAAKTGLKAISDYASGTGKNVDELSQKFTLITRSTSSYQSIADQFSGILPATSAGFLEQAQAVGILSDKYTQLTQVPIDEYQAAVSKMLQQGVADLGLANNTMNEAFSTLSGSLSMAKGAWSNLVTGLADDTADLDMLIGNFVESVGAVATNLIPKIGTALNGASKLVRDLIPVIVQEIPVLIQENLPVLAEAAISIMQSLVDGIANSLPTLITTIIDVILQIVNTLTSPETLTNLINAGIQIIIGLISGLVSAIPKIIEAIPTIITNLITALLDNIPLLIDAGIQLIVALVSNIPAIIGGIVKAIPKIITGLIDAIIKFVPELGKTGLNLIKGLWEGIKDAGKWLWDKISGFFGGIVDGIKDFFGIHSPSRLFRDEIGKMMAKGIGVGFDDEFAHVKDDMEDALNFDDASVGINASIRKVGAGAAGVAYGGTSFGDVYINIDGANYSDPQGLAVAVAQELQNMTDRRLAVYA